MIYQYPVLLNDALALCFKQFELPFRTCKNDLMSSENTPQKTSLAPELIERYQLEYARDPKSKVFAPLSEAYRRMGLVEEALRIAENGVKLNPDFASGRVALARILIEKKRYEEASSQLSKAIEYAPENLLAYSLLGELHLQLRQPKEALNAFKMVLFLNPNDDRAKKAVSRWEFLTADEYDSAVFRMEPIFDHRPENVKREVERAISLADALTVRNDLDAAIGVLQSAQTRLGDQSELGNRIQRIRQRLNSVNQEKKETLEVLLQRINERRLDR